MNALLLVLNIKSVLKRKRHSITKDPEDNGLAPKRLFKDISKCLHNSNMKYLYENNYSVS